MSQNQVLVSVAPKKEKHLTAKKKILAGFPTVCHEFHSNGNNPILSLISNILHGDSP